MGVQVTLHPAWVADLDRAIEPIQQTILNTAAVILPPVFGLIVGAAGWTVGFGLVAVGPFAGYLLLRPLAHAA